MSILSTHRFSTSDYHRMAETGILQPKDRVELLNGEIIEMSPIGSRHSGIVTRLINSFATLVPKRAMLGVQNPISIDDHSEPQPDVALLRPRYDAYSEAHPKSGDVLLLIEVSDSSAVKDRQVKLPLYARAGVAEVWIVDLNDSTVTIHRDPSGETYRSERRVQGNEAISPAAFPDIAVNVRELLR